MDDPDDTPAVYVHAEAAAAAGGTGPDHDPAEDEKDYDNAMD